MNLMSAMNQSMELGYRTVKWGHLVHKLRVDDVYRVFCMQRLRNTRGTGVTSESRQSRVTRVAQQGACVTLCIARLVKEAPAPGAHIHTLESGPGGSS